MKLRPQFNLRFRDVAQFEWAMDESAREHVSMNEWVLRRLEGVNGRTTGGNSGEIGNNSEVVERGVGSGIAEPDAGAVRFSGRIRTADGGGSGAAAGAQGEGWGTKEAATTEKAAEPALGAGNKRRKGHGEKVAIADAPRLREVLGMCTACGALNGAHFKGCEANK